MGDNKKVIPDRLIEDLKNIPKYKIGSRDLEDEYGIGPVPNKHGGINPHPNKYGNPPVVQSIIHENNSKETSSYIKETGFGGLSVEKAIYDEILGPLLPKSKILPNIIKANPNISESSNNNSKQTNENELSSIMIRRMTELEIEIKTLRRKFAEQLTRNQFLDEKNKSLTILVENLSSKKDAVTMQTLQAENQRLHNQLHQMENFLNDYGLIWVGSERNSECSGDEEDKCHQVDYKLFQQKINELNSMIENEPAHVQILNKQAKLVHAADILDTIMITFYSNGILINQGPFRNNTSENYSSFIKDILYGYFPSEFKMKYPHGVLINLIDQHTNIYNNLENKESKRNNYLNSEQVTRNLPKNIIHKGEILDIQNNLVNKLNVRPKQQNIREIIYIDSSVDADNIDDVIMSTLNIRWLDNSVLQMNLPSTRCVYDVKSRLQKHFLINDNNNDNGDEDHKNDEIVDYEDFDLYSAYPVKKLELDMTLLEAACVPHGVLRAKHISTNNMK